jgi:hypothetical protein
MHQTAEIKKFCFFSKKRTFIFYIVQKNMKRLKYPRGIFAIFLNSLPYLAGPNQVQSDQTGRPVPMFVVRAAEELPPGAGDTLWNDPLLKQITPFLPSRPRLHQRATVPSS